MFKRYFVGEVAAILLLAAGNAQAAFHLWIINEVYSNASGTIQFVEFTTPSGSQQFLATHTLTSSNGSSTQTYTYPSDINVMGGSTANKKFLMATSGFAALGIVTPDYIIPDGFLYTSNLTLNFSGYDALSNLTLPTNGVLSLNRGAGTTMTAGTNSPTNFAGVTGSIMPPAATPPGAPTLTGITRGNGQASLAFTPPASNGGATITSYTATCIGGSTVTASGAMSPILLTGLANGTSHTCSVTATNSASTGPASNTLAVTPATVPDAPTFTSGTPGDGQITALFLPSASNGGSPITLYTVQCASNPLPTKINTGIGSPITVTGMTNDTAYDCAVIATNAVGNSAPSNLLSLTPSAAAPLALTDVKSRKTHGAAGTFDLPIVTGIPVTGAVTVEPRANSDGHLIVFEFTQTIANFGSVSVTDAGSTPIGNASAVASGKSIVVALSGLPDNQRATIAVTGINGALDISAAMGFLVGDINNTGTVNASDIVAVKSSIGSTITLQNFRVDVNASGAISASDVPAVKARAGKTLQ